MISIARTFGAPETVPAGKAAAKASRAVRSSRRFPSTVEGDLRAGLTALDALAAAFPAGTVSSAPKVRAMEIIDELEPARRGPYAGATGYYGVDGRLDTCITLRTALIKDGVAYFQAGGGVVADSVPSVEYEETRNKAGAIRRALEVARSRELWL